MRLNSSSNATRASSRASGAPMQWWIPSPNATWRDGSRVMSRRSGSSQRRSSRLADAQTNAADQFDVHLAAFVALGKAIADRAQRIELLVTGSSPARNRANAASAEGENEVS